MRAFKVTLLLALAWSVGPMPRAGAQAAGDSPALQQGEIRLVGAVKAINAAGLQFVLDVSSFALPDGRSSKLAEPKPKTLVVTAATLIHRGVDQTKLTLGDLKVGDAVAAVGPDQGSGNGLAAREVLILSDAPKGVPAAGTVGERGMYIPVRDANTTLVAPDGTTQTGGRWALIIGCNAYDPTEVGPLKVAVADAVRMRDTLIQSAGFPPENVILLTDDGLLTGLGPNPSKHPTYTIMRGQIAKFVQMHKASDALVVFFAGHGFHSKQTGKDYLAPLDVQRADLDRTAIGVDELLDQLRDSGAHQCVLIADACRNVVGRAVLGEDGGVGDASLAAAKARGVWYLSSCAPGQTSQEDPTLGGGVYTYYFAEGLKGAADGFGGGKKDGLVTVTEAQSYAAAKVEAWSRANGANVQLPCRSERDVSGGEIVLSIPGNARAVAAASAAQPAAPQPVAEPTPKPAAPAGMPALAPDKPLVQPATKPSEPVAIGKSLLTLHFEGNMTGVAGQTPTTMRGVLLAPGKAGQAAFFPPSNQVTYPSAGNINAKAGTVVFWIKPSWNGDDGKGHGLMSWGGGGGLLICKDVGGYWRMILNRFDGNGGKEQGTGTWITKEWHADEWHHAAFTWDAQAVRVYVDGQLKADSAVTMDLPPITAPSFQIGGADGSGDLEATLDEFEIYDKALSEQQIASRYKAGN